MTIRERWKAKSAELQVEVYALYLALRNPGTPWPAKILAGLVVAYALSPVDLIPDFIPVLGYLDDLLIIPIGIWLVRKLIPGEILEECRRKARAKVGETGPVNYLGAALVILIWVLLVTGMVLLIIRWVIN